MEAGFKKVNITYCGVYCGACSWKWAGKENDEHHLTERGKMLEPMEKQYWLACPGCKVGSHRSDCEFRICAEGRGLDRCVDCAEFPCKRHEDFNNDGVQHHANTIASLNALKNNGEEAWLGMQEKRWTCSCGARLSWYLKSCLKCGKLVDLKK